MVEGPSAVVLLTGGTGYLGRALGLSLAGRRLCVRALVRPQSEARLPRGVTPVRGDALSADSIEAAARGCDTLVHLVGTPHPASWKQKEFERVDRASLFASVEAARRARIRHFVYVSVAHPAPAMRGYITIRQECEQRIRDAGLPATILRPWYVLGQGHRWPLVLAPLYWLAEQLPATRAGALRLGLVTHGQMISALVWAVRNPVEQTADRPRVIDVPAIRATAVAEAES